MATTSFTDSINTTSTLWLAYCSNPARTVDECVAKTNEVIAAASPSDREWLSESLGKQITNVHLNRGDDAIVPGLFAIDNGLLALGCVEAALNGLMRGVGEIDVAPYLSGYATRYGECRDFLVLKLRWLTLYPNYTDNIAESERIIAVLTAGGAE